MRYSPTNRAILITVFLCFFLCISSVSTVYAEVNPPDTDVVDIALTDDGITYFAYDHSVTDGIQNIIDLNDFSISGIDMDEERIYVYSQIENNALFRIYRKSNRELLASQVFNGYVLDFSVQYPLLALCLENPVTHCLEAVLYNIITEQHNDIPGIVEPLSVAIREDGETGVFLHLSEMGSLALSQLDCNSLECTYLSSPPYGHICAVFDNACIIATDSSAYLVDWGNTQQTVTKLPITLSSESRISYKNGQIAVYCNKEKELVTYSLKKFFPEEEKLTLAGTFYTGMEPIIFEKAIIAFEKKHPNMQIDIVAYETIDELLSDLHNTNSEIDILLLSNFDYYYYVKMKLLSDLSTYKPISELLISSNILKWPFQLAKQQNQLLCIPFDITIPTLWVVNNNLLDQLDMDMVNEDWTWEDFFSLAPKCVEKGIYLFQDASIMFSTSFINTYIDLLNGDKPINADYILSLCDEYNAANIAGAFPVQPTYENVLFQSSSYYLGIDLIEEGFDYVLPPRFSDQPRVIDAETGLLSISTHSNMPDIAAEFIAMYYQQECPLNDGGLHPLVLYDMPELYIDICRRHGYTMTQRDFDQFISILDQAKPRSALPQGEKAVSQLVLEYTRGEVSSDEFSSNLQQIISTLEMNLGNRGGE